MANWAPLRELLAGVDESVTLAWGEIEQLVGGMPPSALNYREFWSGNRSAWAGFTTRDVRMGSSVTFDRRTLTDGPVAGKRVALPSGATAGGRPASARSTVLDRASALTGITDEAELIDKGLEALVRLESSRRLAALGGSDPRAESAPRGRESRP